ncbi:rolling circle replication-associated protein [Clostridium tertium]
MERLYNEKLVISGERLEVYRYSCYLKEGKEGNNKEGRKGKGGQGATEENKVINRKATLYRARNKIIRLISSNQDLNTFITLTYKENFKDLTKSKEHLKLFFKKLQKDYQNLKYVYVLEYQERGAIHYHFLCNIEFDIKFAKSNNKKNQEQKELEKYFSKRYWSNRGFADIRNLKDEGNTNVAKYVSVYLVEDLMELDLKGSKCYGYSRNLNKPIEKRLDNKQDIKEEIDTLTEVYNVGYTSNYELVYTDKKGNTRSAKVTYLDCKLK